MDLHRAPLPATWWQDTKDETFPDTMPADLTLMYEDGHIYIDGLRGGQYLSLSLVDLFAAIVESDRTEPES